MQLRNYQTDLIKSLYAKIQEGHRRIGIFAGTGSGKTIIAAAIAADAIANGLNVMFLVHLDILVEQTAEKMQGLGLHCGFIKAGWPEDLAAPMQIASLQTMASRGQWQSYPAQIIIFDEAHTTMFSQIGDRVLNGTHKNAIALGMTATPERLGKEQLGDILTAFVAAPTPADLTAQGHLAPLRYYTIGQPDLAGVRISGEDYQAEDLKNACDRPEMILHAIAEWERLAYGKRSLAFCIDVAHARRVAWAFSAKGIPAASVDGGMSSRDRRQVYDALAAGEILVLASCNVITIGFDEPSVEAGLMLRPTQSSALHFQMIGRVMRLSPQTGKQYGLILDQAGNLNRHGTPDDIEGYSLPKQESTGGTRTAPKKSCPECGALLYAFHMRCQCGHIFLSQPQINKERLIELCSRRNPASYKQLYQALRRNCYTQRSLLSDADTEFTRLTNQAPAPEWRRGSLFGDRPSHTHTYQILNYLAAVYASPSEIEAHLFEEVGIGLEAIARRA